MKVFSLNNQGSPLQEVSNSNAEEEKEEVKYWLTLFTSQPRTFTERTNQ